MKEETKQNLKNKNTWLRIVFMILFIILLSVARIIVGVTILFQIIVALITGKTNNQATRFGKQLSIYIYDILLYLTFNSEVRPFPFSEWPSISEPEQIEEKKE